MNHRYFFELYSKSTILNVTIVGLIEITITKVTNRRQSKSTVDFIADLSPVCRKSTVAGSFNFVDRVVVDIVDKVEHV